MRSLRSILTLAMLLLLGTGTTLRAQTASQTVTFRVNPISEIAVSGSPAPIVVDAPRAKSPSSVAMMGGTSYAITTNEGNQKISAALDRPMPNGVQLAVSLGAPAGGASRGAVLLGTRAAEVVSAIPAGAASALPINYTLSATPAARQGAAGTRIVTYTIAAGL
jgi:hypothetical protein